MQQKRGAVNLNLLQIATIIQFNNLTIKTQIATLVTYLISICSIVVYSLLSSLFLYFLLYLANLLNGKFKLS